MHPALATPPPTLRDHYVRAFGAHDAETIDRILAWILGFPRNALSGTDHVQPLVRMAEGDDANAVTTIIMLWNHHHEPWLAERMTFHGKADLQEAVTASEYLSEYARFVHPQASSEPGWVRSALIVFGIGTPFGPHQVDGKTLSGLRPYPDGNYPLHQAP